MRACCVPSCKNNISPRYYIPTDERIRNEWLRRINNEKLIGQTDKLFLKNYAVCQDHFENICIESSGRLKKFAVPTLNMPGYDELLQGNCFLIPHVPQHQTSEIIRKTISILPEGHTLLTDEALVLKKPEKYYPSSKKEIFILPPKPNLLESSISKSDDFFEPTASTSQKIQDTYLSKYDGYNLISLRKQSDL